jgi:hypothetical protein
LVQGFTQSWAIEFGVDLGAHWRHILVLFSVSNLSFVSPLMVDNVSPVVIVPLIAKWE